MYCICFVVKFLVSVLRESVLCILLFMFFVNSSQCHGLVCGYSKSYKHVFFSNDSLMENKISV